MATNIGTGPQDIPLNQFLGEMAFMDAKPKVVGLAKKTNSQTPGTTAQLIQFPSIDIDTHLAFGGTNNTTFTVPHSGNYLVMGSVNIIASGNVSQTEIAKNGSRYSHYGCNATNHPRMNFNLQGVVPCDPGDQIQLYAFTNSGSITLDNFGYFLVYLL